MYKGFLLTAETKWLSTLTQPGPPYITDDVSTFEDLIQGDPLFISRYAESTPSIHFHAGCIPIFKGTIGDYSSRRGNLTLFMEDFRIRGQVRPSIHPWTAETPVTIVGMIDCLAVIPPIPLHTVGIDLNPEQYVRPLKPEDVLSILRALPESAQTDWTKRVVARNNDLPL